MAHAYIPRAPHLDVMHQVVSRQIETVKSLWESAARSLPAFVINELRAFLRCGQFQYGFVRVYCDDCRDDTIVAFSCKGRGICPSCTGRRMNMLAANLCERVLPEQPHRQYVLTFPYPLRLALAYDSQFAQRVIDVWNTALIQQIELWGGEVTPNRLEGGSLTFVQRFGSDLRLNVHFHTIAIDGAYDEQMRFVAAPPPSDEALLHLLQTVAARIERMARRLEHSSEVDVDDGLGPLLGAAIAGKSATPGDRQGKPTSRLGIARFLQVPPRDDAEIIGVNNVRWRGFSLHADTLVPRHDRQALERLVRYTARGPIASPRLTEMNDGRLRYELKRPWRDGTTAFAFTPAEFVERLLALIPPPRINTVRYHGVFAPRHRMRAQVVRDRKSIRLANLAREEQEMANGVWELCLSRPPALPLTAADLPSPNWSWAELMRRTFGYDLLKCEKCGGKRRVISTITQEPVIEKILCAMGIETIDCEASPARAPPEQRCCEW